ncbi:M48 family metallopeptidase [Chitinimonas arctica]|nr:M48 family metalloprotease [Chitinimonas arctica]
MLGLSYSAFSDRRTQYRSFVTGWHLLRVASALEVLVQGAMLVWLSFWVTVYFWDIYSIKLVTIAGIAVGLAAIHTVRCIFLRSRNDWTLEGEAITEATAPALWARVRHLAGRLQTAAPTHIVAGIDSNFFVTEAPLNLAGTVLHGRTLFISIPLLRLLDQHEADAVLSHELAHLQGGDAASSALLGPKLAQYDLYCRSMAGGGLTIMVYHLMAMYRVIFEIALMRDSREREFLADRLAAKLTSGKAIVQSLIKVAAYSHYRSQIEHKLFEQNQQHGVSLGIANYVASGLEPYAASPQFIEEMKSASVPHPFDSHPLLEERMRNVQHEVAEQEYSAIVTLAPTTSWANAIRNAHDIEQRLWAVYEQRFAANHEMHLAYRYGPANEAELAIVLKYFPPIAFNLKKGRQIVISYSGVTPPGQKEISWDSVSKTDYADAVLGSDALTVKHPEKGFFGAKQTKIKLPGLGKQKAHFKAAFAHYWTRHQAMRQEQRQEALLTKP